MALTKYERRKRIKKRIRKKFIADPERPRMTIFRSNKHICAHIVDDIKGGPILGVTSLSKSISDQKASGVEQAKLVGKQIAKEALEKGIEKVVFDRNGYLYHGRVKALAESAREGGLKF